MSVNNGSSVYNEGMTNADVQALIDNALPESGTPSKTYAVNITGTSRSFPKAFSKRDAATTNQYSKLFTLSSYNTTQASAGIIIAFLSRDSADNNLSGFVKINFTGNTPKAFTTILSNGATPAPYVYNTFLLALNESNKWEVWVNMTTWSIVSAQIISEYQNYEVHTNFTSSSAPVGSISVPFGLAAVKPFTGTSTGSQSIPVYVKADGSIEACTNDFIHTSNLNDVFTDDNGDQMTETPPQQYYVTGKFYFIAGKVCCCTAYSAASATFDVYGVVEALNYVLSKT